MLGLFHSNKVRQNGFRLTLNKLFAGRVRAEVHKPVFVWTRLHPIGFIHAFWLGWREVEGVVAIGVLHRTWYLRAYLRTLNVVIDKGAVFHVVYGNVPEQICVVHVTVQVQRVVVAAVQAIAVTVAVVIHVRRRRSGT